MNKAQAKARVDFADWLKKTHPEIYARAVKAAFDNQATLQGLGEEPAQSFWQKFTSAAAGLGTTYLALKNQKEAMKINLARAQAGQPPIDVGSSAPVVRTQVDVSPQLQKALISTAGEGINKTLMLGALGIAAFILARKFL